MATVLKSMELDDEERIDMVRPFTMADANKGPEYPYGLRISLSQDELEKLGLDPADAEIDGYVMIRALGCITSVSSDKRGDGTECHRVEIQIEQMDIDGIEDDESSGGKSDY